MIIVTGGAGFIGSHLLRALNDKGRQDILVVDDLSNGRKFSNLLDAQFHDLMDKDAFLTQVREEPDSFPKIEAIFHQGACTVTTEWDGRYMMDNNYRYSRTLLEFALARRYPFYYASSAAVYGVGKSFREQEQDERPVNVYGYSKYLFDCYVRRILPRVKSPLAGLRYFNVYGPGESHKGRMASVIFQQYHQLQETGTVKLFAGSDGYGPGEQRRDFIHVRDVVKVNLWLLNQRVSGLYNVGTGVSHSFNEVARVLLEEHGSGSIEYIPFPEALRGSYQSFTEAELSRLREFLDLDRVNFTAMPDGVRDYVRHLRQ